MEKLIILEEGADLDALSSAYGILLLYPDSKLLRPKALSKKASQVFKDFSHLFRLTESVPQEFELILVDTQDYEELLKEYGERIKDLTVYDHHPPKDKKLKGKLEMVGSATTLVVEELMKEGIDISPESATLLSLGIYEDTGALTYEGTTPRDAKALSWLLEKGVNLKLVRSYLSQGITKEEIDILSQKIHSIETLFLNGKKVVIVLVNTEEYEPKILELVYELKDVKDAHAFFLIVSAGNKTYLFGRSIKGEFEVNELLEKLGGGGHTFAGAVKIEGAQGERLKSILISLLEGKNIPLRVKDVMSSPPFVLHQDMSVSHALLELSQRNFAGAPVVDDKGNVVGIIYKKNLLKAEKHFSESPIRDFMIEEFHKLSPNDFVWKAEEILARYGEKLIPVMEGDKLLGVITRLDLLKGIREQTEELKAYEKRIKLPPHIEELCKEIGELSHSLGFRAYLVGGSVRDLLLKKEIWDLDFVIEGDAIEVAKTFAEKKKVGLHPFSEFGTAHIKVDKIKLEFATTRREAYPHPGAYPMVEYASLKEDLLRRDFTINAMALSVNPEDFGTLIDYFGGLRDLKEGLIRVLHPLSFVEDPVRILRALRFAGRFHFKLSKSTEKLLRSAVSMKLLSLAPKGRLMNELRLALREERFLEIVELYRKYGVLEQVIRGLKWSPKLEKMLFTLKDVLAWHRIEFPEEKIDAGWVYFIALLKDTENGSSVLKDLSAPGWVRESYELVKKDYHETIKKLKIAQKNSEIYAVLKGKPLAFLLLLFTEEEVKDKVRLYVEKLRKIKVAVEKFKGLTGKELGEAIEREKMRLMDSL